MRSVAAGDGRRPARGRSITRRLNDFVPDTEATKTVPMTRARFELRPGDSLGRYRILTGLGAGGMGVVYKAYDEDLGRNVALKILRVAAIGSSSAANARARLMREAQALAQLSHPNVITVYDVGVYRDNVFVAMELIEGRTLRDWLDREKPSRREVVAVFAAAARGLAAAHEAGLIHRDFKPSNVMIGDDGRVRILDFGLARVADRDDAPAGEAVDEDTAAHRDDPVPAADGNEANLRSTSVSGGTERYLTTNLTEFGAVIGTPAYMAPEQHRNQGIEARSDQFAFCVTLFQALYKKKPFAGKRADEIKRNVLAGRMVSVPRRSRAPRWLHRVVVRGLEIDIDKRYPSMHALAADLSRERGRRLRYAALVVIPTALLGAIVALSFSRGSMDELCQGSRAELTKVWNPDRAQTMKRSFLATDRGHAADTHARVAGLLDDYGDRWVTARVDACEATHKRGEQSPRMLDYRMACLGRRLRRLEVLVRALTGPLDGRAVDEATRAVLALPGLESCADVDALARAYPLPAGADERDAIKRVEALLDELRTDLDVGRVAGLLERAEAARLRADATRFPPLQGRAYLLLAAIQEAHERYQEAEDSLEHAARLAARAHDDDSVARAWIDLINIVGSRQGRVEDAFAIVPFAETAIVRADGDALLEARLGRSLGWLHATSGQYDAARDHYERALEILTRHHGLESPQATASRLALSLTYGLAGVLASQADYQRALDHYRRLREIIEVHYGADHVYMLNVLGPIAENLSHLGELEEASAEYRRILQIARHNGRQEDSFIAAVLANFAETLLHQHQLAEAQELLEQAVALRSELLGPAHPVTANALRDLALVRLRRGDLDAAAGDLDRARAIYDQSVGPEHPSYATWQVIDAELALRRRRISQAHRGYLRALEIMEASTGARHPIAARALAGLGAVATLEGQHERALDFYSRARDAFDAVHGGSHPRVGRAWLDTGAALLALERYASAHDHFTRAHRILSSSPAARRADLARTLTGRAESQLGLQAPSGARAPAREAVALWTALESEASPERTDDRDARDAAWSRFTLARSLWDNTDDREYALRLAHDAQQALGAEIPRTRHAAITRWLAQRR